MRYVPSLPPLPSVKEDEAPRPLRAVRPVRPVAPRMRVPRVIQHFGRKPKEAAAVGPEPVPEEKRSGVDRRKWCRRLARETPFLNTRSGVERRKKVRRSGELATTLDEEG